MSKNIEESAGAGSELFPDAFLNLKKVDMNLTKEVIILLAEYYYNTYNKDFVLLLKIHLSNAILILLKVNVYRDTKNTYADIVKYYFEHTVHFLKPEGSKKYSLVFVKWYLLAEDYKTRFYCKIDGNDNSCNIELWKKNFYDLSRDCIIPVHSILDQFVEDSFSI
ncbi:6785_t:CDS:2, partial [Funneliformis mosseae]